MVYSLIVFNYTTVLYYIAGTRRARGGSNNIEIAHIHGRIDTDVVLGIENINQFEDNLFAITKKLERTFLKPSFNQAYDDARLKRAIEMIEESDVICVYGMALGESDKMWIDQLIK